MSVLRSLLVGVLVLLLTVNVVAANAAVATERSVLDSDFVKSSLEEEGAYEAAQTMLIEVATEQLSGAMPADDLPVSVEDIVREVVTQEYLKEQVETNIDATFAYLHGDEEELELVVDLAPVKERAGEAVAETIREMSVEELLSLAAGEGETSISTMGMTFDAATFAEMAESPEAYDEARDSFRSDVREEVVDQMVDEAFESYSNDQLLDLVIEDYDPDEYDESEKEEMVEDNEGEIRTELRSHIEVEEGDRIDDRIDSRLEQVNDAVDEQIEAIAEGGLEDEEATVAEPTAEMLRVGVAGLTTDMTYQEYSDELEAAKGDLADNASAVLVSSMNEEMPDRLDVTEELDPSAREQLESARQAVVWFDRAAIALPIIALVMIGLIYLASRSLATTAFASGTSLLVAGAAGLVAARLVPDQIERILLSEGGSEADAVVEVIAGLLGRIFGTLGTQSVAIAIGGLLAIALGVYVRSYGLPDWTDRGEEPDGAAE